jgi:hypothetical protein
MAKKILVIVVVIIALLMMAAPVSAVVKPPTTVKDALFKGVWGAIMDLQNQIDALTQRVDNFQTNPIPEYRAGSYTTPPPPEDPGIFPDTQTVTFSHPMPDTNYRVSITNTNTGGFFYPPTAQCQNQMCIFTIDSKTTTGFTFSIRSPLYGTIYRIDHSRTFDYIAIADN